MNFKLENITDSYISVSVEDNGLMIVADFSRTMFKEKGYIDAENVKFLNDKIPENATFILPKMMTELSDWVAKEHSGLLNS